MQRVGLVGWRGMVGSVLMDRMVAENDFAHFEPVFFSTSNAGGAAPTIAKSDGVLHDGNSVDELKTCDIILTSKAATTPTRFSLNCAQRVGMATGLMQPQACVWPMMRSLFWIR